MENNLIEWPFNEPNKVRNWSDSWTNHAERMAAIAWNTKVWYAFLSNSRD